MWQMGGFGPMPGQVHHFIALENETGPRLWPEALHGRDAPALRRAGPPARRAANSSPAPCRLPISPSSAGPGATRATRSSSKDFPNVERWYNTLMARPAAKRGMEAKLD